MFFIPVLKKTIGHYNVNSMVSVLIKLTDTIFVNGSLSELEFRIWCSANHFLCTYIGHYECQWKCIELVPEASLTKVINTNSICIFIKCLVAKFVTTNTSTVNKFSSFKIIQYVQWMLQIIQHSILNTYSFIDIFVISKCFLVVVDSSM